MSFSKLLAHFGEFLKNGDTDQQTADKFGVSSVHEMRNFTNENVIIIHIYSPSSARLFAVANLTLTSEPFRSSLYTSTLG